MKKNKLIAKLQALLDSDQRDLQRQAEAIEDLLQKLSAKEARLGNKLENAETEEEREKLEQKIAVCAAQREKGLAALIEIKQSDEE